MAVEGLTDNSGGMLCSRVLYIDHACNGVVVGMLKKLRHRNI